MRKLKLLVSLILLTCFSCENKNSELFEQDIIHTVMLKFDVKTSKKKKKVTPLAIKFNFQHPLLSKSETLIVKEGMHKETQKMGYAIIPKKLESQKRWFVGESLGTDVTIERGYFFDGGCCFLYSTWVTDTDTGVSLFIREPDLATQYLMDDCDYCNVA